MFDKDRLDSYFTSNGLNIKKSIKNTSSKHTTLVKRAKVILPSFAALLLGLLIAYPSIKDIEKDIRLHIIRPTKGELEKLQVENTNFYITDKKNQVHNFTSTKVFETEAGSKLIKLQNPQGIIQSKDEQWIDFKSPTGFFDQNKNILTLKEDVDIFYSNGMTIDTKELKYDFNSSVASSNTPVVAQGYMGDIDAQNFTFDNNTGILTFNGKTIIMVNEKSLKGN